MKSDRLPRKQNTRAAKGSTAISLKRAAFLRNVFSLAVLFLVLLPVAAPVAAAGEAKYTITVPTAFLRSSPSLIAANTLQVYMGEFYTLTGRSADNTWVRLDAPVKGNAGAWLLADLGAVAEGKLADVPIVPVSARIPAAGRQSKTPAWIPVITPQMKQIYRQSARYGKDLSMFTVVGDCNSLPPVYLQRVAAGLYDLSRAPGLQSIVARFARSFSRVSLAVNGGFKTAAMMDPDWADHTLCDTLAGPFACEVWVSRASVVFIELGTGDQYEWQDFEQHYRPLIEHALSKSVLPVLVTKADDLEARSGAPSGYINDVIRKLANEYNVPLLDFWAGTRTLPNNGLLDEGDLDFHLSQAGMDLHLLATLQTLDAISR